MNVEESDNYATECSIYERLTKAPPTLLDVCVRAPALVPVMLASGWLLMFRTRNGRQERPFLHHRNSGWCITPRLALAQMPQGTQPRSWNGTTGLARRGALTRVLWFLCCCARTTKTSHTRGLTGGLASHGKAPGHRLSAGRG